MVEIGSEKLLVCIFPTQNIKAELDVTFKSIISLPDEIPTKQ